MKEGMKVVNYKFKFHKYARGNIYYRKFMTLYLKMGQTRPLFFVLFT